MFAPLHNVESAKGLFNGTVERMCPTTFLSELTELKSELEIVPEMRQECAVYESAENMRAVWCLSTKHATCASCGNPKSHVSCDSACCDGPVPKVVEGEDWCVDDGHCDCNGHAASVENIKLDQTLSFTERKCMCFVQNTSTDQRAYTETPSSHTLMANI